MPTLVAIHEVHVTTKPGTRQPFVAPEVAVHKPGSTFSCTQEQADDLIRLGGAVMAEEQAPEPVVPEKTEKAKRAARGSASGGSSAAPADGSGEQRKPEGDDSGDDMV